MKREQEIARLAAAYEAAKAEYDQARTKPGFDVKQSVEHFVSRMNAALISSEIHWSDPRSESYQPDLDHWKPATRWRRTLDDVNEAMNRALQFIEALDLLSWLLDVASDQTGMKHEETYRAAEKRARALIARWSTPSEGTQE